MRLVVAACLVLCASFPALAAEPPRHPVPKEHPRLLGSREYLQSLAKERPEEYRRVVRVARELQADDHAKIISLSLVAAIENDKTLGRQAVQMALRYVDGPIRKGHVTFGVDLALSAIAYDLCHDSWTDAERRRFHEYVNKTVDANVNSETSVFHNGWFGYKNWGIGLACYAAYYENPRAAAILKTLEEDARRRTSPALELAGDGGGWAEGYYIHYFLYEWLFFCEAARRCEGLDYYALAPGFFKQRAIAGAFEMYPGIGEYGTRRPVPMGDGGGRVYGGDRDKALAARRILVNHFRGDPAHRAVHAFNETTPRSGGGAHAYKDFLWRDPAVKKGDLDGLKLSHLSPGPGYVYARSSWNDDATYFFFKCGRRFTAHQHLDNGHFVIYKQAELAGDGGHYDGFGTPHDVNYHLRTIAHNTVLVHDPAEKWPAIRAGSVDGNDGGQHHDFPHHNGAVLDPQQWAKQKAQHDIAELLAYEDRGAYLYAAGDATRSYSPKKLDYFTRQIVFIRPGTFVIFDRVKSKAPSFKKTWLLQAMQKPAGEAPNLVVTNGKGRLFVQTLLPENPQVRLAAGDGLYSYGGKSYPPQRDTGPAPQCRIEVSPAKPAALDYFLHVLTATGAGVESAPQGTVRVQDGEVRVTVGKATITFDTDRVGGRIALDGKTAGFAQSLAEAGKD